jgi:hypothetical protein
VNFRSALNPYFNCLYYVYGNWPSKNCVKKIRNGDVKKNLRVAAGLNFLVVMSSPRIVIGDPKIKNRDSLLRL